MPVTQHAFVTFCESIIPSTSGPFPILLLRIDNVGHRQTQGEDKETYVDSMTGGIRGSVRKWSYYRTNRSLLSFTYASFLRYVKVATKAEQLPIAICHPVPVPLT